MSVSSVKALTLWQPWASLIAAEIKTVETRPWPTHYRGPLLIHAAKFLPTWNLIAELLKNPKFQGAISRLEVELCVRRGMELQPSLKDFIEALPRGAVVAKVWLDECAPAARVEQSLTPTERALGYYDDGRFAFFLKYVDPINPPVPLKGRQRLWTPPEDWRAVRC